MSKTKKGTEPAPKTHGNSVPDPKTQPQEWDDLINTLMKPRTVLSEDDAKQLDMLQGLLIDDVQIAESERSAICEKIDQVLRQCYVAWSEQYARPEYEDALVAAFKRFVCREIASWRKPALDVVKRRGAGMKGTLAERAAILLASYAPNGNSSASDLTDLFPLAVFVFDDGINLYDVIRINGRHFWVALRTIADNRGDVCGKKQVSNGRYVPNGLTKAERFLADALKRRWTIQGPYTAAEKAAMRAPEKSGAETRTENGFDLNELNRLDVPTPTQLCVMHERPHSAITGIGERGAPYQILARDRIIELDEGIAKRSVCTIITAGKDWTPMRPEDVWPYQRLISLMDELRLMYDPYILPVLIPVETAIRWAFGNHSSGNEFKTRVKRLRKLLAYLRRSVTIDWRQLVQGGYVEMDKFRREFGLSDSDLLPSDASLFSSVWYDNSPVNRNGLAGPCIAVTAWPMEYLYAVASQRILRLPDELTELVQIPGEHGMRESELMIKVKAYLLDRIARLYRNSALSKDIALAPLYEFLGLEPNDRQSRAKVRKYVERYLNNWQIPRDVPSLGRKQRLIAKGYLAPEDQRIKASAHVQLVRGGLNAIKRNDR